LAKDLRVIYKDQSIDDPYLLVVRLINTGNKDILEEHFAHPVKIELGAPAKVISPEIAKTIPDDMDPPPQVEKQGNTVLLAPMLFNRGDWIAISILTDGEPGERRVITRIAGGTQPRVFKQAKQSLAEPLAPMAGVAVALIGIGILGSLLSMWFPDTFGADVPATVEPPLIQNLLLVGGGIVAILLGVLTNRLLKGPLTTLYQRKQKSLEII
jgi:hypothetical protein